MQLAERRTIASDGARIFGSARSSTRTSPGAYITAPCMDFPSVVPGPLATGRDPTLRPQPHVDHLGGPSLHLPLSLVLGRIRTDSCQSALSHRIDGWSRGRGLLHSSAPASALCLV